MNDMFEQIYDALNVQVVTLIEQSKSINAQNDAMRDALAEKTRQCLRKDERIAELEAKLAEVPRWLPIETAPKDGTGVLLSVPAPYGTAIVIGAWTDDKYAKNPRPYWTHDRERIWGVRETRDNQPTHWMPLPALPAAPAPSEVL